jgi:AraC-like DNA-binding protein
MPVSQFSRPSQCLERFIRFYVQRDVRILGGTVVHPVPARPAPMIVFDFNDRTNVLHYARNAVEKSALAVVVGPQTYRRLEMQLQGALDTFVIAFQPDGIYRLFSVPTQELTDRDFEAQSVLGNVIHQLGERLGNATSFAERVGIVEEVLVQRALLCSGLDPISAAVNGIILAGGHTRITTLAARAGLGVRQFERRFVHQVGMRPKLFARIARFEATLEYKALFDSRSWTSVAHTFGYYDQMHMVHDFAEFTGGTPSETLNQLEKVFVEQIRSLRTGGAVPPESTPLRLVL